MAFNQSRFFNTKAIQTFISRSWLQLNITTIIAMATTTLSLGRIAYIICESATLALFLCPSFSHYDMCVKNDLKFNMIFFFRILHIYLIAAVRAASQRSTIISFNARVMFSYS